MIINHTPKQEFFLVWSIDQYGFISVELVKA